LFAFGICFTCLLGLCFPTNLFIRRLNSGKQFKVLKGFQKSALGCKKKKPQALDNSTVTEKTTKLFKLSVEHGKELLRNISGDNLANLPSISIKMSLFIKIINSETTKHKSA